MFGDHTGDDINTSAPLQSVNSRLSESYPVPYQSAHQDTAFASMASAFANLGGPSRENGMGLNSRPSDFGVPGSVFLPGEAGGYNFDGQLASSSPMSQSSRPVMAHQPMSFPLSGIPSRDLSSSHSASRDLNGYSRQQAYPFDDSLEPDVGHMSNMPRATNQFNLNNGSQAWSDAAGNGSRGFAPSYQTDAYGGPMFDPPRRHSSAQNSLTGSVNHSHVNSPRFMSAGTPRVDRPTSRNIGGARDLDRSHAASQLSHNAAGSQIPNNSGIYSNFYGGNYGTEYSQPGGYAVYNPNSRFQNAVPMAPPYNMPLNQITPGVNPPLHPRKDLDPGKGVRSIVLENFRASNKSTKKWELKEIYGHIVEFSGDQHGSRFIQDKLVTANSDEKERVFREIEPNALQLMKDVFGNYVIQKFFEHGNQVQKHIIAAKMKNLVHELSMQMYACRVVQKALDHVLVEQQREIIDELKPHIMRIVQDQNGNHVVQKIISMAKDDDEFVAFVMTSFSGQIKTLAGHTYACRVIQRLLEKKDETIRRQLMKEIHACAPQLIVDQYGNYVAQHIIEHPTTLPEDRRRIIQLVCEDPVALSRHKFASNVVEKVIQHGTTEERRIIRAKLTAKTPDDVSPLQSLMKDQFGNYVIQKMLTTLDGPDKRSFAKEAEPHLVALKKNNSGPKIGSMERLVVDALHISEGDGQDGSVLHAAVRTPTTPGLQLDVSGVPTPGLTTEHNSPDSSSPPSTNLSTTDETVTDGRHSKITSDVGGPPVVVNVDDAER